MVASPRIVAADPPGIARAAELLCAGKLVAFPTETVYGLGADGFSAAAVERIFRAKGRPAANPLILHVASREMAASVCSAIDEDAARLMERFWPGPLSIVLPRAPGVPAVVSAGLATVAVRMPAHEVALSLVRACGRPLAAPSANSSGRPSPTLARHVLDDLGDRIDAILDGGPCRVGIESTVLDATRRPFRVLRPGGATVEAIEDVLGYRPEPAVDGSLASSPGTRFRHYRPTCRVRIFAPGAPPAPSGRDGVVVIGAPAPPCRLAVSLASPEELARRLYALFREADEAGVETLYVEAPGDEGIGRALRDRLTRAASEED